MDVPKEREHLLALKVMRLTKPSLIRLNPLPCERGSSEIEDILCDLEDGQAGANPNLPACAMGQLLSLPQSFGNIFLGQTFSSYISIHNDSNAVVTSVSVKAELQTQSQRLSLQGSHPPSQSGEVRLRPEESLDDVIHHEVKELGTHILVCSVNYTTPTGENLFFRKFFKFQVFKPLDVKTKFYNAENNQVYLEAQVQNITEFPLCMERVTLEPSSLYNVVTVNEVPGRKKCPIFGQKYLLPQDTRQYLYCLTPRPEHLLNLKLYKGMTSIGKLDIAWKSGNGEKGRLQTSQLQRMAPGYGDIRLTVEEVPAETYVMEPFSLVCHVTNCCERTMQLQLHIHSSITTSLQWSAVSGRRLGQLLPNSHLKLNLTAVPLDTGLLSVSALRLTDTFLNRTYEYDDITQVLVKDRGTHLPTEEHDSTSSKIIVS